MPASVYRRACAVAEQRAEGMTHGPADTQLVRLVAQGCREEEHWERGAYLGRRLELLADDLDDVRAEHARTIERVQAASERARRAIWAQRAAETSNEVLGAIVENLQRRLADANTVASDWRAAFQRAGDECVSLEAELRLERDHTVQAERAAAEAAEQRDHLRAELEQTKILLAASGARRAVVLFVLEEETPDLDTEALALSAAAVSDLLTDLAGSR